MGKSIRFSDLMTTLANRTKLSEKTVRKVYNALFEIVAEELRFSDEVRLKRFGVFSTVQRGGRDRPVPRPDGTIEMRYIEPYQKIKFKPAGEFTNYANGKLVDKESKKRKRKGKLTKNETRLLNYKTDDKDKNLELAIEKIHSIDSSRPCRIFRY